MDPQRVYSVKTNPKTLPLLLLLHTHTRTLTRGINNGLLDVGLVRVLDRHLLLVLMENGNGVELEVGEEEGGDVEEGEVEVEMLMGGYRRRRLLHLEQMAMLIYHI